MPNGVDPQIRLMRSIWWNRCGLFVRGTVTKSVTLCKECVPFMRMCLCRENTGDLLDVVSDREFLTAPIERLVKSIQERLDSALPKAFRSHGPMNEADLTDKIEGLLVTVSRRPDAVSTPRCHLPLQGCVPTARMDKAQLLIEGKYVRGATKPSKVTEGMSADLIKYPSEAHVLFVVYHSQKAVIDRFIFKKDFESKGRCTVCILP